MKQELRNKIHRFNKERAENAEKGTDLIILLDALPPGQVKQLLKDETCAAILKKYGVGTEE